jgi:uncharacterized protein (DUF1697 family)
MGSTTWIALLRGVNVGGHNRVPMADFRAILTDLGYARVETYIQSGNAVFDVPDGPPDAAAIRDAIGRRCGVTSTVILRQRAELLSALTAAPYRDAEPKGCYLLLLADTPSADAVARLDPNRSPGDRMTVIGRDVHIHYGPDAGGAARSKLTLEWFQRTLRVDGTVRNWNTVEKLTEMADRQSD